MCVHTDTCLSCDAEFEGLQMRDFQMVTTNVKMSSQESLNYHVMVYHAIQKLDFAANYIISLTVF